MTIGGTEHAFQKCCKTEILGIQIHITEELETALKCPDGKLYMLAK